MGIGRDGDWKDPDVVAGWGLEGTSIGRVRSGWRLEGTAIGENRTSLLDEDWKGRQLERLDPDVVAGRDVDWKGWIRMGIFAKVSRKVSHFHLATRKNIGRL